MLSVFFRRSVPLPCLCLVCSTHQSPRLIDHSQLVMELRYALTVLTVVGSCEDFLEDKLAVLDWQKDTMDMWRGLVQVHIKGNNVLLTRLASDEILNVRSPLFYLRHTLDCIILLVVTRLEDHLLLTEGKLTHLPLRATEDEVSHRTEAWLCQPIVLVLDATSHQVLCHQCRMDLLLSMGAIFPPFEI